MFLYDLKHSMRNNHSNSRIVHTETVDKVLAYSTELPSVPTLMIYSSVLWWLSKIDSCVNNLSTIKHHRCFKDVVYVNGIACNGKYRQPQLIIIVRNSS